MLPIHITPTINLDAFLIYLKQLTVFWYQQSQLTIEPKTKLVFVTRAETYESLIEDIIGMYNYTKEVLKREDTQA